MFWQSQKNWPEKWRVRKEKMYRIGLVGLRTETKKESFALKYLAILYYNRLRINDFLRTDIRRYDCESWPEIVSREQFSLWWRTCTCGRYGVSLSTLSTRRGRTRTRSFCSAPSIWSRGNVPPDPGKGIANIFIVRNRKYTTIVCFQNQVKGYI